jgi:predicted nucleic acid-binding protein
MAPPGSPIFVDGSAWIGASDRRDQHHERARTLLEECIAGRIRLVTTTWTGYEALSVLKSRGGADAASGLWSLLTDRSLVTLIRVTEDIEARDRSLLCLRR